MTAAASAGALLPEHELDELRRRFVEDERTGLSAREIVESLVGEAAPLAGPADRTGLVDALVAELVGLGRVEPFLLDTDVTDVLVTGDGRVWVDRGGHPVPTAVCLGTAEVATLVERAFRHTGLAVDRAHPIGEARLETGARISVVLPPLAPDGTQIAIRSFAAVRRTLADFAPAGVVEMLREHVHRRSNIVVFGPTGSGKTSLIGALCAEIDPGERVVTIEDTAELRLALPHVVRLEARPPNGDGAGGVALRGLVRAALRLRPDRVIVGEVRGAEALDMVWAMSTGHDGSMSTVHARSAADALHRLETFVLLADADLPLTAVRAQVVGAVDVLVGVRRTAAGRAVATVHAFGPGTGGTRSFVRLHPPGGVADGASR